MDKIAEVTQHGVFLLDGHNYHSWSHKMHEALKTPGIDVWKSVTTGYTIPKKVKTMTQKDARKNNSMAKEIILEGLTDSIRKEIGNYLSAKELWESLEQFCIRVQDTKNNLDSAKKCSSEYLEPNEDAGLNSSPEIDNRNDVEGVVDMEEELISALEEIDRLRLKKRKQKQALIQYETSREDITLIKLELEEEKKIEIFLKQQLAESKVRCELLEKEVVTVKKELDKYQTLYNQNMSSIKASEELHNILNRQRAPQIKYGLGYSQGESSSNSESKNSPNVTSFRAASRHKTPK